ncbi:hypothetical protein LO762_30095 [Actinocorallia sp. API 0066]|uniref:hypothetical protein n=1 Tax=Actinocorallia sp. API 0066 TaxID=2896846 RepID=UPI001E5AA70F|nr:hypothetical protein [Actinocorallia sp. API 0066]MCD0453401.1 hypothetical protein [Actinocorallia sp. API 0066]
MTRPPAPAIGSFACVFGDLERAPADLPGFADLWRAASPDTDFAAMGCGTFRTMTRPPGEYVADCVKRVLADRGVPAGEVDRVVFATSDATLARLGRDFAVTALTGLGMTAAVPTVLSFRQCCGSLEALRYGWETFADPGVRHVVVVALDFTPDDAERIRQFALFGDAVAGLLISRTAAGPLRLVAATAAVDPDGLAGHDSFVSRQRVARAALDRALDAGGTDVAGIAKAFPTNLYEPLTVFNTMAAGLPRALLHFTEPMRAYAHCGNCDWIINLADYADRHGLRPGERYLALASAPGFFACGLLEGTGNP